MSKTEPTLRDLIQELDEFETIGMSPDEVTSPETAISYAVDHIQRAEQVLQRFRGILGKDNPGCAPTIEQLYKLSVQIANWKWSGYPHPPTERRKPDTE